VERAAHRRFTPSEIVLPGDAVLRRVSKLDHRRINDRQRRDANLQSPPTLSGRRKSCKTGIEFVLVTNINDVVARNERIVRLL